MKIKFWGVWGSLPCIQKEETVRKKLRFALNSAIKNKVGKRKVDAFIDTLPLSVRSTYGGNTPCIEVIGGNEYVICDAGSGIRDLAAELMKTGELFKEGAVKTFHILMSHLHWDHTQGFPFFIPAYIPGVKIHFYGCHKDLQRAFESQQETMHFPVKLAEMKSDKTFTYLEPEKEYEIAGLKVVAKKQNHPGDSYGYKFTKNGKVFVYATDSEHTFAYNKDDYEFIKFFADADALIFDSMYPHVDAVDGKAHWGHSSNMTGVEIAVDARVKNLFLFHHDCKFDDFGLEEFLFESRRYKQLYDAESPTEIHMSREGQIFEL